MSVHPEELHQAMAYEEQYQTYFQRIRFCVASTGVLCWPLPESKLKKALVITYSVLSLLILISMPAYLLANLPEDNIVDLQLSTVKQVVNSITWLRKAWERFLKLSAISNRLDHAVSCIIAIEVSIFIFTICTSLFLTVNGIYSSYRTIINVCMLTSTIPVICFCIRTMNKVSVLNFFFLSPLWNVQPLHFFNLVRVDLK